MVRSGETGESAILLKTGSGMDGDTGKGMIQT